MENKVETIVKQFFKPENVDSVKVFASRAIVTLKDITENAEINAILEKSLLALPDISKVSIIYTADKKVQKLNPKSDKYEVKAVNKIIGVASGKGGVGKSTTSVNLALALQKLGLKVAIFDADIYGPSIPTMLGYEGAKPISYDGKTFEAFDYKNVKSMSIGTLLDKSQPLIWRGSKACGAIEQLLTETNWGEIDVMVIDMPDRKSVV